MTNPPEMEQLQLALPGLSLAGEEFGQPASPLRDAVAMQLEALAKEGLVTAKHAGLAMLALEMADSVTSGRRAGRASAAAMAAAQLRETLQALPQGVEATEGAKFEEFVESLRTGDFSKFEMTAGGGA